MTSKSFSSFFTGFGGGGVRGRAFAITGLALGTYVGRELAKQLGLKRTAARMWVAGVATIPILIVVLSAIAAMLAEAIRHPGERMYIAGFGLIGLVGAAVASCFLWDTDAVSFGVVRADNFALFINIILCIVTVGVVGFLLDRIMNLIEKNVHLLPHLIGVARGAFTSMRTPSNRSVAHVVS